MRRAASDRLPSSVALVSGKGGVGRTNLAANLALAAAAFDARVLVVDGDLGLANVNVLLALLPERTAVDVLEGRCELEQAVVEGPRGVRFLAAATARSELAALDRASLQALLAPLARAARDCDLVLVDVGAGIGPTVVGLASACERILLVTTPEPTSLADCYATLKVMHRSQPGRPFGLIVNSARDERDARRAHEHLQRLASHFLALDVAFVGFVPRDPKLVEAVLRQRGVVELFPGAPSSRRVIALAETLLREAVQRRGIPPDNASKENPHARDKLGRPRNPRKRDPAAVRTPSAR